MVVGLGVAPLEVCRLGGSTAADPRFSNFLPLSLLLADIMCISSALNISSKGNIGNLNSDSDIDVPIENMCAKLTQ